jgi:hypothetical protein
MMPPQAIESLTRAPVRSGDHTSLFGASSFFEAASPDAQEIFRRVQCRPLMNYSPEKPEGKDHRRLFAQIWPELFRRSIAEQLLGCTRPTALDTVLSERS